MDRDEFYRLAEEYAQKQVETGLSKNVDEDVRKRIKLQIKRHFIRGGETVSGINLRDGLRNITNTTLNVRLELASNGAIFTDLDCEDKYLATEVFLNEREEDVAIYEELGGWLYTELEHRGLVGKNIELSIKVKEI